MQRMTDYTGKLLSHLNALHRPGERDLAVELAEALGFTAVLMPLSEEFSLVAAHADAEDQDAVVNVIYLAEMSPGQAALETLVEEKAGEDRAFAAALEGYREQARSQPDACVHFGVRFPSDAALAPVLDRLNDGLSPELRKRVTVKEMPSYGPVPGFPDIRQVFVYTDVFSAGSTVFGQLIELQVERSNQA